MSTSHCVIVGGGHAAGQLADSLRREAFAGRITLVTEEALPPYQRPHLSKLYLAGRLDAEKLLYRPRDFYRQKDVALQLGVRVESVDRDGKSLHLSDATTLAYDRLALCTGASVRRLSIPGADSAGVFYLRTVDDTNRIRASLDGARNVVFIGGGFLGMEAAGVVATLGKRATVLEMQPRIMAAAVAPVVSDFFQRLHAERGVDIRTGTGVTRIMADGGKVTAVETAGGALIPADLVLVSIGVVPNTALAERAGLTCRDGICVDEFARTSDPEIVSAGDCTRHPNALLGRELRLESVHNAVEQAKTAAATLCGRSMAYTQVPWFWSDQHDFRLQMVGLPGSDDETLLRGDPAAGSFSVLYFRAGNLVACQAVNRPMDYMNCRKLLENGIPITKQQAMARGFDPASRVPPKAKLAFQKRNASVVA